MAQKGPQASEVTVLPAGTFEFEGQPGRRFDGIVKLFNAEKGWGFVTSEEIAQLFSGKDIFLHKIALQDAGSLPQAGQEVSFKIEVGDSGKLQAKEVVLEGMDHTTGFEVAFCSIAKSSSESCSILIRLLAKKIACTNNANWEMWGCKIAAVFQCCIACILIDGRRSITAVPAGYRASQALPPTLPVVPTTTMAHPAYGAPVPMSFASPHPAMLASTSGLPMPGPGQAGPVYAAPVSGSQQDPASPASVDSDGTNGPYTRGFPDPASIEEQKKHYCRSLEEQLEEGNKSLQQQNVERKKQLHEAAEQQKQALLLHMDQQVKMQEMALDEQTNQAMMGLKKAALDQRAALEQQAASLTLEYQQRKMHEEFAATQAEMQRQYMDSHSKLQTEVQRYQNESKSKMHAEWQRQLKERGDVLGPSAMQPVVSFPQSQATPQAHQAPPASVPVSIQSYQSYPVASAAPMQSSLSCSTRQLIATQQPQPMLPQVVTRQAYA
ncbi:cspA [Symbiodinium pilosum]|uniref:CspA protein n=1 Tax=Symbiodinium pilosum TaxID=2952 RepID=A0A812VU67_SYMPI|nr:cspA [Symbiodinium pilosum]